jgi:hypothetical protein
MSKRIEVLNVGIRVTAIGDKEYICLTDIGRYRNPAASDDLIRNWIRNRNTLEFLGLWELIYNREFKSVEFDGIKMQAGLNSFSLTPKQWIDQTSAIGIQSRAGRYGGTYAHPDIAFEFAAWISVEFKLYLIKEFQRLKESERRETDWDIRRNLAKINYRIHTDAIQHNLLPVQLTASSSGRVFSSEADLLNLALFGRTASEWRSSHPNEHGNIRDHATGAQLVCLSNLENLNALFIQQGISQTERLQRLNEIAIAQMKILTSDR